MPKTAVWQLIHQQLSDDIAQGHVAVGEALPTEAELVARFQVNRHTVRRALAALQAQGVVYSRRGAGCFVAQAPARYRLGKRTRLREGLGRLSAQVGLRVLASQTRPATAAEAKALGLKRQALVHWVSGVRDLKGQPISYFEFIYPAQRFVDLPALMRASDSVSQALALAGLEDYTRAQTTVSAVLADAVKAGYLGCAVGAALLHTRASDVDHQGQTVAVGQTWFVGERVEFDIQA